MRTFLSLSLLFVSLTVAAQQTTSNSIEFKKLSKGRYSISYPDTWTADTSRMYGMDLLLRSPKTDSLDDFMENMSVFIQDLKGQGYSLYRMGKESDAQIRNMVTDVQVFESRLDSTSSQVSYIIRYRGRQGKFKLIFIQQYYLIDEVGYALTFTLKEGKEEEYLPLVERMINSFELK